jgi:hypothetical protein
VSVPLQVQRAKVFERRPSSAAIERSFLHVTPECLGCFNIDQMRRVKADPGIGNPDSYGPPEFCAEEQFYCRGGIETDHFESRSARMIAAALGLV